MFLPNYWPNYYKKVRDVKFGILKIKRIRFCRDGVTACSLGYANKKINSSIIKAFNMGNLTTLNSLEVELARLFKTS